MNADLLLLLNVRRQAAAAGWRLAARRPAGKDTVFRFERDDDLDGGYLQVRTGWWNGPGDYSPARIATRTPDGFLVVEHVSVAQAVAVIRALFGWDLDVDAVWPPVRRELVAGGVR